MSSPFLESFWNRASGRGVLGVVSSPERPGGGSGTARVVLTAWKLDMLGRCSTCGARREGYWVRVELSTADVNGLGTRVMSGLYAGGNSNQTAGEPVPEGRCRGCSQASD